MTTVRAIERLEEQLGEVLERHGTDAATIDLNQYRGRPVDFAKEVLKFEAYDRQCELLTSPLTHKFTVARGNHSAGKDATFACLLLYEAFVEGKLCLAISATEKQLLGQLWVEVRRRFAASELPGVLLTSSLEIGGEKRAIGMTSGSVSNLTGWHDPHGVCVLISEAQGEQVEAAAYDAAMANATDDRSVVVAGGNPIKASGRFFEIHQKPHWHQIHFSALDHPNVREGREVIPGGPSAAWVKEVAAEYGEDSAYYHARVLGQFPTEGSIDQLIARADVDRAFALFRSGQAHVRASSASRYIVADLARGGPDSTCVAVVRGHLVEELETFREPDLMKTARRLYDKSLELGWLAVGRVRPSEEEVFDARCRIITDDAGLGGGCTDRLRELRARVFAFNGAETAQRRPDRFANRRAEAYWELRDRLMRGTQALPPNEMLAEELTSTNYTLNSAGKIIIEEKKLIRQRLGRSPDRADTVSMASSPPQTARFFHVRQ